MWICLALLIFTGGFYSWDANRQWMSEQGEKESRAESAKRSELFKDPQVKRGMELFLRSKEGRAATRATSAPASQP